MAVRTAVRWVPIPTIMQRAGWRTMSTFLRYRTTDLKDQADANAIVGVKPSVKCKP